MILYTLKDSSGNLYPRLYINTPVHGERFNSDTKKIEKYDAGLQVTEEYIESKNKKYKDERDKLFLAICELKEIK